MDYSHSIVNRSNSQRNERNGSAWHYRQSLLPYHRRGIFNCTLCYLCCINRMDVVRQIGLYILFAAINILMAAIHDAIRRHEISIARFRPIHHGYWAAGYLLATGLLWPAWPLMIAVILQRLALFPLAFNFFAEKPLFNLSKTSKALTDRLLLWVGFRSTEIVTIVALVLSIVLLTIKK